VIAQGGDGGTTDIGFGCLSVTGRYRLRRHVPVEDYLRPQRRYAHLFGRKPAAPTLARIQAMADRNIRRYGLLAEVGR